MNQPPQIIVLATRNPGKIAELAVRLEQLSIEVISAADIPNAPDVVEDAGSLQGNAEKKAKALFDETGLPSLADDTGLEVDALDGAPGVYSARFAGPESDERANRAKLLTAIKNADDRSARFRTALAFIDEAGTHFFDGVCEGKITDSERGSGGFGYDSIFQPLEGGGRTFAEMSDADKNRISHRGRALEQFVAFLVTRGEVA
ncbi:MAG: RdgB/HAM1 family non-canonical purine NTP pyrophosphatase [Rubricoccaceae bacterium]|nr:RdgB/HAM1 family non-canonical purine NTP pyrophosphatase [Rubricoccaceae bacterium]